jgi:hypothetical protein
VCGSCSRIRKVNKFYYKLLNRIAHRRNDPNFKGKKDLSSLKEIISSLKVRHKRTVERKAQEGAKLSFDEEKGIINTIDGEIVVDIKHIYYNGGSDDDSEDKNEENDKEEEEEIVITDNKKKIEIDDDGDNFNSVDETKN